MRVGTTAPGNRPEKRPRGRESGWRVGTTATGTRREGRLGGRESGLRAEPTAPVTRPAANPCRRQDAGRLRLVRAGSQRVSWRRWHHVAPQHGHSRLGPRLLCLLGEKDPRTRSGRGLAADGRRRLPTDGHRWGGPGLAGRGRTRPSSLLVSQPRSTDARTRPAAARKAPTKDGQKGLPGEEPGARVRSTAPADTRGEPRPARVRTRRRRARAE